MRQSSKAFLLKRMKSWRSLIDYSTCCFSNLACITWSYRIFVGLSKISWSMGSLVVTSWVVSFHLKLWNSCWIESVRKENSWINLCFECYVVLYMLISVAFDCFTFIKKIVFPSYFMHPTESLWCNWL